MKGAWQNDWFLELRTHYLMLSGEYNNNYCNITAEQANQSAPKALSLVWQLFRVNNPWGGRLNGLLTQRS